ncbi:energy transducer TonB [Helicobacter sp. MIT 05-5293]|uniref:energy transducer TonB n=1 Tax=Helicobacter sp. MIT 05-5293 TaxID=1548149 RepID=UPI00051D4B2A|nr:energy transducer TonB [Helicobacter sp. MIT 05-5293]TLD80436.1 energy transducer TonB [Helicobacter sp. MIT 05-5293]
MKTLAFQPKQNKSTKSISSSKIGFTISLALHGALLMLFYNHFHQIDLQQDGDAFTTISLATFQTPSNEEQIDPKPKPIVHKKKKHHKEIFKEYGKLAQQEEEIPPSKQPKAQPDEKIEEGDMIQTLSYRNGEEDEVFSKIKRAIDRKNRYPTMARKRGLEGEVIVEFVIYKDGRVANIKVTKPCSHNLFNEAAVIAIRKAQSDFPTLSFTTKVEIPIVYELERI